jgi:hypothetical protein
VLGIDAEQLTQFVEHTADLLMETFKQPAIYNAGQPFAWMNRKELAMTTSGLAKASVSPTAAKAAGAATPGTGMDQVSERVSTRNSRNELQHMSVEFALRAHLTLFCARCRWLLCRAQVLSFGMDDDDF